MIDIAQSPGPGPEEVIESQVETPVRTARATRAERVDLLETLLDSLGSILQGWRGAEEDQRREEPAEGQDTGTGDAGGRTNVRRRDRSAGSNPWEVIMIYRVSNIEWDTNGEDPTALDLPPSVRVECDDEEEIADLLSDEHGYRVFGFTVEASPG